jgi:hypothetical protein
MSGLKPGPISEAKNRVSEARTGSQKQEQGLRSKNRVSEARTKQGTRAKNESKNK